MKTIFIILFCVISFSNSIVQARTEKFKVTCNKQDCFQYGWVMTNPVLLYRLDAQCKKNDCLEYGWTSHDNRGSRFDVTCKTRGCFSEGWSSIETVGSEVKLDYALCKGHGCLIDGWYVSTNYGEIGDVSCNSSDCSTFGGSAFWRKKNSRTTCIDNDCYRYGWYLEIDYK